MSMMLTRTKRTMGVSRRLYVGNLAPWSHDGRRIIREGKKTLFGRPGFRSEERF